LYLFLMGLFVWIITHTYYPLPDYDPYTWLNRYQDFYTAYLHGNLLLADRPAFFSGLFAYNEIAHIPIYSLLKYVLPATFVLTTFSSWIIARKIKNKIAQACIMTMPIWSASTVLYATIPMPQALFISAFMMAISFLAYARITKQETYYFLAGAIFFLSIPTYEVALIPSMAWLIITLLYYRRTWFRYLKNNAIVLFLLLLLLVENHLAIISNVKLFGYWISKIAESTIHATPNLLFPAQYINIDGNAVGWHGIVGVSEYYAFYVGIPVIIVFFLLVIYFFNPRLRSSVWHEILSHPSSQVTICVFAVFFTISEIAPRAIGLAFLPERAWIFGGIAIGYAGMIWLYASRKKIRSGVSLILIIATLSSIGAALYINNSKKYLIPTYDLVATNWVTRNLPKNRILFTESNSAMLSYFSVSPSIVIPKLYCDAKFANPDVLKTVMTNNLNAKALGEVRGILIRTISSYIQETTTIDPNEIAHIASRNMSVAFAGKSNYSYYVYYSLEDPRNPYVNRPYNTQLTTCNSFIYDKYPDMYQRIYTDGDKVIIWKIK
ncbi:MAG: hypothetical protein ABIP54_05125, partial [Candidatus Andersenbacteria bacterium]